jgi:hypothetical protein
VRVFCFGSRLSYALGRGAAAIALTACVVGCGESMPSPVVTAVQSYLSALSEGNYSTACSLLDSRTRKSLLRGSRTSCATAFTRCLPDNAQSAKRDQSQLLYATVQVSVDGSKAHATVSGTPVAGAIKRVTLARERRRWKLTSSGAALKACRLRGRPHRLGPRSG